MKNAVMLIVGHLGRNVLVLAGIVWSTFFLADRIDDATYAADWAGNYAEQAALSASEASDHAEDAADNVQSYCN